MIVQSNTHGERVRLPDQFHLSHRTDTEFSLFILLADRLAREKGVFLSSSEDFSELKAVNEANRDSWESIFPAVDPRYHTFAPGEAFWLRGVDATGQVVLTRACRRVGLGEGNLCDALTSLRLLYGPNSYGESPEEVLTCFCPSASGITGTISIQSGAWHHPDYRGRGLSAISARMVKALALAMWGVGTWASVVDDSLTPHLVPAYGVSRAEPGISWRRYGENLRMHLLLMNRPEFDADIKQFMRSRESLPPAG